jgi:hypothetical protein
MRLLQSHFNLCLFILLFAHKGAANPYNPTVKSSLGEAFLVLKDNPSAPIVLEENQTIDATLPYSAVTPVNSYLEIESPSSEAFPTFSLRLGQSSGIEFRKPTSFYIFKGSFLIADKSTRQWKFESNSSVIQFSGSGTFMIETTPLGFKLIILEGLYKLAESKGTRSDLTSGDLILISGHSGEVSQSMQVELPLILNSSRLVNYFPNKLSTHSRLISAAQVQALRMKSKYNAFIGGVSEDRQLRIWKVPSSEKGDK